MVTISSAFRNNGVGGVLAIRESRVQRIGKLVLVFVSFTFVGAYLSAFWAPLGASSASQQESLSSKGCFWLTFLPTITALSNSLSEHQSGGKTGKRTDDNDEDNDGKGDRSVNTDDDEGTVAAFLPEIASDGSDADADQAVDGEQQNEGSGSATTDAGDDDNDPAKTPTGVIVLGMHRSGTSLLTGLLTLGYGFHVGGPLMDTHEMNAKGFFELKTAWTQNNYYLAVQKVNWRSGGRSLAAYNVQQVLHHKLRSDLGARRVLRILNGEQARPWIHKDPRECLTLPIWVRHMNRPPAVVFTFRHPMDVAMSLWRRDNITLDEGLSIWMVYNQRAIENSRRMCRVTTSNDKLLEARRTELERILFELTERCHVPAPPNQLSQQLLDEFIDPDLQHGESNTFVNVTAAEHDKAVPGVAITLRNYSGCAIPYHEAHDSTDIDADSMYVRAMMLHCDLQSGQAYEKDYAFPALLPKRFTPLPASPKPNHKPPNPKAAKRLV